MSALTELPTGESALRGAAHRHAPVLLSVGTAVPPLRWSSEETFDRMAAVWHLRGAAIDRWRRIVDGSEIEYRHAVMPPDESIRLSTGQRMHEYERRAPALAWEAAARALEQAAIKPRQVTDLVVVSCTGFSAPGVDVALIERLGLQDSTRRTTVGFMGCFGAINGLRVAAGLCAADPDAIALVVCVELCSLHMRDDPNAQNLVASALFADGAAAAVLVGHQVVDASSAAGPLRPNRWPRVGAGSSLLIPQGRDWMTWRITDAGFAMTLTRDVPLALRDTIAEFVRSVNVASNTTFVVHPGGPGVLDAVDDALTLNGAAGIECSRHVLARFGNMSSGTVLFVLDEVMRRRHRLPMLMLAFGPGLTIEGLRLESAGQPE